MCRRLTDADLEILHEQLQSPETVPAVSASLKNMYRQFNMY